MQINIAERFIEDRFPDAGEPYKQQWRDRFVKGTEWAYSDSLSRKHLQVLAPEVYPDDISATFPLNVRAL